jgi:hypothetical protein
MKAKKKKKVKAKSKSRKRSTKRSVKDLSPRAKAKSVKGGLLPAVNVTHNYRGVSSTIGSAINPGTAVLGDGSV